ncbi:MacS family sensor histidine kinase [Herbidospora mongoliensis]|uniref:MacS family sensor histidine kinase n=1 Tax=Herbidospora mongoliensis TaxID=688067 RepID=UPI00082DDEC5|nr:DUF5931 domain-containing protein [Herbidospora mongoliensis]
MSIETPFWRAIAVFRVCSLGYAGVLLVEADGYDDPIAAWAVFTLMAAWTAFATYAYARDRLRGWPLLTADLVVTGACLLSSIWVQGFDGERGSMPITATWVAAPVVAWAVYAGRRAGAVAAAVIAALDIWLRGVGVLDLNTVQVNGAVLLFLAGVVIGHVAQLSRKADALMQQAVEIEAAGRERERLARGIHDSVLQVLALVQRRGAEIGGEAAELGRLAGEQEAVLRELVRTAPRPRVAERADLNEALRRHASATVTVATPATPVDLPARTVDELEAAVANALSNVNHHCPEGTKTWILVEAEDGAVTVTVRDDGPGIPEGRLEEAARAGRLGVSQAIRGRVAALGGSVTIVSSPDGTEIEMVIVAP